MSHFVRCDRCAVIESRITPNLTLPPGWQRVLSSDLCERCCAVVRDFINFRVDDAAKLPVEPIEAGPAPEPSASGEKLFETEPLKKVEASCVTPVVSNAAPTTDSQNAVATGAPIPPAGMTKITTTNTETKTTQSSPDAETSTEERVRTKAANRRKKLMGQDAILPDKRKPEDSAQPGAPA